MGAEGKGKTRCFNKTQQNPLSCLFPQPARGHGGSGRDRQGLRFPCLFFAIAYF